MTGNYVYRGRSPRQTLEAKIWRWWPTRGPEAVHAVDAILAAADTYLRETIQRNVNRTDVSLPEDHPYATARRRQAIADAVCPSTKKAAS